MHCIGQGSEKTHLILFYRSVNSRSRRRRVTSTQRFNSPLGGGEGLALGLPVQVYTSWKR